MNCPYTWTNSVDEEEDHGSSWESELEGAKAEELASLEAPDDEGEWCWPRRNRITRFFFLTQMNYEGSTHPMSRPRKDAKKSCQEQGASCERAENGPITAIRTAGDRARRQERTPRGSAAWRGQRMDPRPAFHHLAADDEDEQVSGGLNHLASRNTAGPQWTWKKVTVVVDSEAAENVMQREHVPRCDIFHLCTIVICYSVNIARAYTSAGPLSLKAKRCFQICHHIQLHRFAHCALNPDWWRS